MHVLTWFVAPGIGLPRCLQSRKAILFDDFTQWENILKARWEGLLDQHSPINFVVVSPGPPHLEPTISAHVLLIQHPMPEWSSPLITIYDPAVNQGQPFRLVATLPDITADRNILVATSYDRDCQAQGTQCFFRLEQYTIPPGHRVRISDGHNIIMQVCRANLPANWCPPIQPEEPGTEGLGLLQLSATRAVTPDTIKLDMAPAIQAFEWIDSHLFLPTFCVPDDVHLHVSCRSWLELPFWEIGIRCDTLTIYLDGSFCADTEQAGVAVAAFICSDNTWYQAGMISSRTCADNSYQAEVGAALVASKFAFDLLKQISFGQIQPCSLWLGFDSLTVGQQMLGKWNSHKSPLTTSLLRSLHRIISARFGIVPQAWHVHSHQGEPGNELVDSLALHAAQHEGSHDVTHFLKFLTQKSIVKALEWAWMLFEPHYRHMWRGTEICLPDAPLTVPKADVFPLVPHDITCDDEGVGRIALCFGTCNVLTLKGVDEPHWGLQGVARQDSILEQFHLQGIHIVALQETRLKKLFRVKDDRYVLVKSAAAASGCYGIILALSKKHPHGYIPSENGSEHPVYFTEQHLSIIVAEPRILIVRIATPILRCIIIAAHAPHSGYSDFEIQNWWEQLGTLIPSKYNEWSRVLLCDANARLGNISTTHVGDFQAEVENRHSEHFRTFLQQQGIWLPSTFSQCQVGPGGTWQHSNGDWKRGDYVGLPVQWCFDTCQAFVHTEIDVSTIKEDHRAAIVQFEGPSPFGRPRHRSPQKVLPEIAIDALNPNAFARIIQPDFTVDVHSHAHSLEQQILQTCIPRLPKRTKHPRKESMSCETWQLVLSKRDWRKHLWDAQGLQKRTILQACFKAWHDLPEVTYWQPISCILRQQDILIAQAISYLYWLGRKVVKALRHDDVVFFSKLAQEAGSFVHPRQAKHLWRVIRRSLPKFQQRRLQAPPEQLEALEEQWHPYFQQLEAGCSVDAANLLTACHQFQLAQGSVQKDCSIYDLPSLQQIENMFRCTSPGKATGLDPIASGLFHAFPAETARLFFDLFLKIYTWQAEPLAYKGGIMAVIPKRLCATAAKHFRGIMLLPSVAKRLHALLRTSTVSLIERIKPAGQIGGFQHQQVGFASQALRTFCRIMQTKGCSTGVLFIDLSNAFHRLVRELVCGTSISSDVQDVLQVIENGNGTTDGLRAWLKLPGLLERIGASPLLVQLLRDVHTNTWHTIAARPGITRTRRGTRPGSPLADIVFHVLMMDIVIEINTWIDRQTCYQALLTQFDVHFDTIVWSDDLAIPWCTRQADELVPAIRELLRTVDRIFTRRGFDLNMDKGKTGAVLTFHGAGSPDLRRTFLLTEPSGFHCLLDHDRQTWLHVSASYRHLGTQFASKPDFAEELRFRCGQAASAFGAMRRQVFCNRHIPVATRLQLFHALVCTRLYFGLGAWATPSTSQLNHMKKILVGFLRNILNTGYRKTMEKITDAQVFAQTHFLEPRIRLAQDRLLYAHKIFQHGPGFAQHLLHMEFQCMSQSWISGLFADIVWLRDVLPDCVPEDWTHTLTGAIEFWQSGAPGWKAMIKRAGKRHLFQEAMMADVFSWHRQLFRVLGNYGATFDPPFFGKTVSECDYHCACGRHFDTAQGLATHRRKAHGIFSLEHDLLNGATCPVCMVHFWTTQRLQQHLSYISRRTGRNACYQVLRKSGYAVDYERVHFPSRVRGLKRIEAIPCEGPQGIFSPVLQTQIANWRQEINSLLRDLDNITLPPDPVQSVNLLCDGLTSTTRDWFQRFCDHSHDLVAVGPLEDHWFDYLATWPHELDDWFADEFLHWGQTHLQDLIAEFVDGEAERIADEAFYEISKDMPRCQMRDRVTFLNRCIARAETELAIDVQHRPPFDAAAVARARARKDDPDAIFTTYQQQTDWHNEVRKIKWNTLPKDAATLMTDGILAKPIFLIVHLFSGRRRSHDVHWHLAKLAEERGIEVAVLSMDTAVSPYYGDLTASSVSWQKLAHLYERGLVAATVCGAPCETFSAARHVPPPDDLPDKEKLRWPRPLRTFARLFGLDGLRPKELRQCRQGSAFMFQAFMACTWHLVLGGLFLSEHPAPPADTDKASVWTSAFIQLLKHHPDFALRIFDQWRWGAPVRKPTGLFFQSAPTAFGALYVCLCR